MTRNASITDFACQYAAENSRDPGQDILDCDYSTQRIAQGSDNLVQEGSVNTNLGLVLTPADGLIITLDYFSIEK